MPVNFNDDFRITNNELFLLLHAESAKVIDLCKHQQWYVVGLGIGINYGMIVISQEYFQIFPCIQFFLSLFMLAVSFLIPIAGFFILLDLYGTINKHRKAIYTLKNQYSTIPHDLKEYYVPSCFDQTNLRDFIYIGLFTVTLLISSIFCIFIIAGRNF